MNETEFQALADHMLASLYATLEPFDETGELEMEVEAGVMTIALQDEKQFVISKHAPTRQLWLSSPISGGLHFSYKDGWLLADGRMLADVLLRELKILANVQPSF